LFTLLYKFVSFLCGVAHTKQKPPLQSKGGQEVRNNQMNCAAYSIYSHALLTTADQEIFFVHHIKNTPMARLLSYIDASESGFDTPSAKNPTDKTILSVLKISVNK